MQVDCPAKLIHLNHPQNICLLHNMQLIDLRFPFKTFPTKTKPSFSQYLKVFLFHFFDTPFSLPRPTFPVQGPVLYRFREMLRPDMLAARQIRNRPPYF
jgi:hypothetical protein